MTFYNVLSALLFLGSLRILLLALEGSHWSDAMTSGCLTVLVFNDMLSTSHSIETEKREYSMHLMLLDLVNFLLLAFATIVISPSKNLFDISLPRLAALLGPGSFWLLLLFYWLLLIWWTHAAWAPKSSHRRRILIAQGSVAAAFFVEWILHFGGWQTAAVVGHAVVLIYLFIYLPFIRPAVWEGAT